MSPTTATDTTAARSTAQRWYSQQLAGDPDARAYLAGRGIDRDLARRLGIGYAPRSWTGLTEHLRGAGYPDQVSVEAGLVMRTARHTTVDRYRGRVMLPVRDGTTGRLVGFTGRATPAAPPDSPRYLDSPTSADYAKGAHAHGLWEGRRRFELGAVPVLAEGAFDAHAVTLAGQGRYVGIAPSGTALTGDQVCALDRVAPLGGRRVVVAFDPDGPGQEAALAAFPLLAARGALVDAAVLPAGLDPAELARAAGPDRLRACLDDAQPLEDRIVAAQLERWPNAAAGRTRPSGHYGTPPESSLPCTRTESAAKSRGSPPTSTCRRRTSRPRWWTQSHPSPNRRLRAGAASRRSCRVHRHREGPAGQVPTRADRNHGCGVRQPRKAASREKTRRACW